MILYSFILIKVTLFKRFVFILTCTRTQMRLGIFCLLFLTCFVSRSQTKRSAGRIIFKEFDGKSENGDWRKQYGFEYLPQCDWNNWYFEVNKNYGKMHFDGGTVNCPGAGNNQHIVRFDKTIDPSKPYTIECDFLIDSAFINDINSFCINFNVQKGMTKEEALNAWSINLDITDRKKGSYTIKNMGFADIRNSENKTEYGRFTEMLPQHQGEGALALPNINHFKIEVNRKIDGSPALKWVAVTRSDATGNKDCFQVDYSTFPYQPDYSKPVRIGLNTHGTDWVVKNLSVYYW